MIDPNTIAVPEGIEHPAAYQRAVARKINAKIASKQEREAQAKRTKWLMEDETRVPLIMELERRSDGASRCSDFYLSLMAAYEKWGTLTERQEAALRRSFAQDAERQKERAAANTEAASRSNHLGAVGERRSFTVTCKRTWSFEGFNGTCYGHELEDDAGNRLVYMGNSIADAGQRLEVKATVKRHEVRDGVKQTVINRPKVEEARPTEEEFLANRFTAGAKAVRL
jgi:hypothetical protein